MCFAQNTVHVLVQKKNAYSVNLSLLLNVVLEGIEQHGHVSMIG